MPSHRRVPRRRRRLFDAEFGDESSTKTCVSRLWRLLLRALSLRRLRIRLTCVASPALPACVWLVTRHWISKAVTPSVTFAPAINFPLVPWSYARVVGTRNTISELYQDGPPSRN